MYKGTNEMSRKEARMFARVQPPVLFLKNLFYSKILYRSPNDKSASLF